MGLGVVVPRYLLIVSDTYGTINGSGLDRYLIAISYEFIQFFFSSSRCLFERAHAIKCSLVKKVGTLTV